MVQSEKSSSEETGRHSDEQQINFLSFLSLLGSASPGTSAAKHFNYRLDSAYSRSNNGNETFRICLQMRFWSNTCDYSASLADAELSETFVLPGAEFPLMGSCVLLWSGVL